MQFIGRDRQLRSLARILGDVQPADPRPGRCVLVRGRRRVGKSRLLEEFCERSGAPSMFFTASRQGTGELALFAEELAHSSLTGAELVAGSTPANWDVALRQLASGLDRDRPSVVVIDEFPYLVEDDPSVEATFQKIWDRHLSRLPVLLVLVGSDLAMMEALNTHGRAFFQRGTELVVPPLTPAEVGAVMGAPDAAAAIDAALVTGGLPLVCASWRKGDSVFEYLEDALAEPTSALLVSAERSLAAELPDATGVRAVLERIGSGERTFTAIARAEDLQATSLKRSLDLLVTKRLVARDLPLSTKPSKEARYRIEDPYLRFWLQFVGPHIPEVERGRGDRVVERIRTGWSAWRGRAVAPLVREAMLRLSPIADLPDAGAVGGYWTRSNVPEIDIVGTDRGPVAKAVRFAGSIKWRTSEPFDGRDLDRLAQDVALLPGGSPRTPLVAVSRSGVSARGLAAVLGPDDIVGAWDVRSVEGS